MKKFVYLIITLMIMVGIFGFSNQPGNISATQSATILNATGLTDNETFEMVKEGDLERGDNQAFDFWNLAIRKLAHISIYFVLTIFILLTLGEFGFNKLQFTTGSFIGIFYAMTDEFHQTFIFGRSGSLIDVLVDGIGIGLAVVLMKKFDKRLI